MNETMRPKVRYVLGHDGRRLTLADLPSPQTKRWVIRRKAEVVAAVRGGLLSLEDACGRYALNPEEFLSWQRCVDNYGLAGLRATRIQFYRASAMMLRHHRVMDAYYAEWMAGSQTRGARRGIGRQVAE
jgi:hypothetical protein